METLEPGFEGVTFRYRGADDAVIRDLSFQLRSRMTFLLGENGVGKTTVFRLLLGELKPKSGTVSLGSITTRRTGYCPQDFTLPRHITAREYLAYIAWLKGMRRAGIPAEVDRCIEAVGLQEFAKAKIRALSGGTRRKVGVAAALIGDPALVLLDEPTVGLDPAGRAMVRETIATLANGYRVLIATHMVEDIPAFGDDAEMLVLTRYGPAHFGSVTHLDQDPEPMAGASSREAALIRIMRGV